MNITNKEIRKSIEKFIKQKTQRKFFLTGLDVLYIKKAELILKKNEKIKEERINEIMKNEYFKDFTKRPEIEEEILKRKIAKNFREIEKIYRKTGTREKLILFLKRLYQYEKCILTIEKKKETEKIKKIKEMIRFINLSKVITKDKKRMFKTTLKKYLYVYQDTLL